LTIPTVWSWSPLRFTHQQLRRLQDEITDAYLGQRHSPVGTYVSSVGIDVHANKVHVGISTDDDEFAAAVVERYGADRVRRSGTCGGVHPARHNTNPNPLVTGPTIRLAAPNASVCRNGLRMPFEPGRIIHAGR
jgi:hypothetical protein